MTYATEQITQTLKHARETQVLSQRALSAKVGVPQSHISKIERGAVDLRASSLTDLARALDLEVMLVPRKSVYAVQAIVRSTGGNVDKRAQHLVPKELTRLQDSVADLIQARPTMPELAQLQRSTRELVNFSIQESSLGEMQSAADAVKEFSYRMAGSDSLRKSLARINNIRNELAHAARELSETKTVWPAYSLDEDDDG